MKYHTKYSMIMASEEVSFILMTLIILKKGLFDDPILMQCLIKETRFICI